MRTHPKLSRSLAWRQAADEPAAPSHERRMARAHLPRQLEMAAARGQPHVRLSVAMLREAVADQRAAAIAERQRRRRNRFQAA